MESKHGLLTTVAYKLGAAPAVYALEGSIAITGALVQWIRDNLGLIEKSEEIELLSNTVKDNGGVYFVPAFSGLYAPYWKDTARGRDYGADAVCEQGAYRSGGARGDGVPDARGGGGDGGRLGDCDGAAADRWGEWWRTIC